MRTPAYSLMLLLTLGWSACKPTQTDSVIPLAVNPRVTTWTNVDSLIGLTDHSCLGVHADSLGLIFMTQQGLSFLEKGSFKPFAYAYPLYNSYWSGVLPTFYKGNAYVITSDHTIHVFPYGHSRDNPFTIQLSDFDLPQSKSAIRFSHYALIAISTTGQMLVQLDGDAPQYLYTLQLDESGKPVRNQATPKTGTTVTFSDSSFYSSFYRNFTVGNQILVPVARNYQKDNQISSTLLGELQRITINGKVETVLPQVATGNVISYKGIIYAAGNPLGKPYAMYKSSDGGKTWALLYQLANSNYYNDFFTHFYTIDNRLVLSYLHSDLEEFDIETNQTKYLSLAGIAANKDDITCLAEYGGRVYLTTLNGGIYSKATNDVWQYQTK